MKMQKYTRYKVLFVMLLALPFPIAGIILTNAPIIWPISILLYNIGLFYSCAMVSQRTTRIFSYIMIAALFFVIESTFFFSYYLQDEGFNEAFFYHIRTDLPYAGVTEHLYVFVAMMIILLCFLVTASSILAKKRLKSAGFAPIALGLLIFGLFISPPVTSLTLYSKKFLLGHRDATLFDNFEELLGPTVTAVFAGRQRPNIVMIYAESVGQRYFDESVFPDLMPNLKRLREKSIHFTNVSQGVGAGWTVAGMVASQCGYPLSEAHDVGGNDLGLFDDFLPRATCLGDILKKDGYRLTFIGGADARFAGKGNFLRSHGYSEILDRNYLLKTLADKSYQNEWGVFDDTLFEFATGKFMDLSKDQSPFLLTLLTLDTHHPNGFLSRSCGIYGSGSNSSLNAIHCTDQLISRYIEHIRNSPYSDNTYIVVLSDHLAMRNQASSLLASSKMPRRLTFFVNTPDNRKGENGNAGIHYDIAPTILDLIGYDISGQMGFGAPLTKGQGYLSGKFNEQWEDQSSTLIAIGGTLWNSDVALDESGIKLNSTSLTLNMGGREFNLRSDGVSDVPESIFFLFDDKSLKLEKIVPYPFDRGLLPGTLSKSLLSHKEKMILVISRARNLPGFSDPRINPNKWVFFFGKPGSDIFSWGPINGDLVVPFSLIRDLKRGRMDDTVIQERENLLKAFEGSNTGVEES
jgi:phosphoglycerol transferase